MGQLIKKPTEMLSNMELEVLSISRSGNHDRLQLRGDSRHGGRSAQAAVFPDGLCSCLIEAVMDDKNEEMEKQRNKEISKFKELNTKYDDQHEKFQNIEHGL